MHLLVAIPTYKRFDMLVNLLKVLSNEKNTNFNIGINVYDNDLKKSALGVVDIFPSVNYVNFPEKGLSNVRNKILSDFRSSSYDYLLMIDDDQIIEVNFLNILTESLLLQKYDIISANVKPKFLCERPIWTFDNSIYWDSRSKKFGKVTQVYGAGCVLMGKRIKEDNIIFRTEFNNIGGEDTAFFTELKGLNYSFYIPDNLLSYEILGNDRACYSWFTHRCLRIGVSEFFVEKIILNKSNTSILLRSFFIASFFSPLFFLGLCTKRPFLNKYVISFLRHIGKFKAFGGFFKESY